MKEIKKRRKKDKDKEIEIEKIWEINQPGEEIEEEIENMKMIDKDRKIGKEIRRKKDKERKKEIEIEDRDYWINIGEMMKMMI